MRYDQIKTTVCNINKRLMEMSFNEQMIDKFWNDILTEAKDETKKM